MRILQTADFHLKPGIPERINILESLINKASEDNCDAMVICGDLFEDELSANKLRPNIRMLFESYDPLKIYLLPGNHDFRVYQKGYFYGKNVKLVNKLPFSFTKYDDWYIVMIPFSPQISFKQAIYQIRFPSLNTIIFGHGTLYDERFSFIYEELGDFAKYMPIYPWDIENKVRYIGLGHFHSKIVKTKFKNTLIAYSGAPVAIGSKCIGARKYIIINLDKNGKFKFNSHIIENSYYWKEIVQHIYPEKEEEALQQLKDRFEKLKDANVMINAKITGIISWEEENLRSSLAQLRNKYSSFFNNIKIENLTTKWEDIVAKPALRNFIQELDQYPAEDKVKDRALELALDGFSKRINKD